MTLYKMKPRCFTGGFTSNRGIVKLWKGQTPLLTGIIAKSK